MKKLSLLICILLIQSVVFSQSKMMWLTTADKYFGKQDYHNALLYYNKVIGDTNALNEQILPYEVQVSNRNLSKKTTEKDGVKVTLEEYTNHQIAMCYQLTFDYKRAEQQFEKTHTSNGYPQDAFHYGNALKANKKYSEAITIYEKFIRSNYTNDSLIQLAKTALTGCFYAMDDKQVKTEAKVQLANDSIFNKGTSSFAVSYFGNENQVMFTSARPHGVILKPEQKSEFLCDVYWTEKDENGAWKNAKNFGRPMNSALHDAASSINNSNTIFYTRWNDENPSEQGIYIARMINFKFFEAFKLDNRVNHEGGKSIHPFVSMDGKTLFFSSNRAGGYGGMDIWKIELDSLGNLVGEASNLGSTVNAATDEITPFFHEASSTLFFSSNGYNTIGGFDVFKSNYNLESDHYSAPTNLGMPINSSNDDTYMIWDTRMEKGFVSSDREPCEFGHCYKIYEVENSEIIVTLDGYTYDKQSKQIIANATISIKDIKGIESQNSITSDENGYYSKKITIGKSIFLKAQKEGYFADAAVIMTEKITESTALHQDFYLEKIPIQEININGIEYDFDSDKLRPVSMAILDKLFDFLELNENLIVEINSHTDYKGSDKYNFNLSNKRAKSCVNYLIEKGINPARLIPKGYGETDPLNYTDENNLLILGKDGQPIPLKEKFILTLSKEEQERVNQLNRRTSFKVIGEDFELESTK